MIICMAYVSPCAITTSRYMDILYGEFSKAYTVGTPTWISWEEGLKKELGLHLKRIEFKLTVLDGKSEQGNVCLIVELKVIAYGVATDGIKKRVIQKKIGAFLFDEVTGNYLTQITLEESGTTIINGWNGHVKINRAAVQTDRCCTGC